MDPWTDVPPIVYEVEPELEPRETLGFRASAQSRITIGRTQVFAVGDDALLESARAAYRQSRARHPLLAVVTTLSFRLAPGERFESAVFTVSLIARDGIGEQPIARGLDPERLVSPPVKVEKTQAVGGSTPDQLPVKATANRSQITTIESQPAYLVATGLNEANAQWRYTRTDTVALEGFHQMRLTAEVPPGGAIAELYASTRIKVGPRRVVEFNVPLPAEFSRVSLSG